MASDASERVERPERSGDGGDGRRVRSADKDSRGASAGAGAGAGAARGNGALRKGTSFSALSHAPGAANLISAETTLYLSVPDAQIGSVIGNKVSVHCCFDY